jgi:hypothetical protein
MKLLPDESVRPPATTHPLVMTAVVSAVAAVRAVERRTPADEAIALIGRHRPGVSSTTESDTDPETKEAQR